MAWIAFDIETYGRDDVADLIPLPSPDGRLTDPVKKAADVERKRAEQLGKLALDKNGCTVVAIGYQTDTMADPEVLSIPAGEDFMVRRFFAEAKGHTLIGYASRRFDLPVLIQRARLLNVQTHLRWRDVLAPYGRSRGHVDLFDELTFDGTRDDGVVPQRLLTFCKLFRIDIPDDDSKGADIAQLVKDGNHEAIREHCKRDVQRTVALAARIGLLPTQVPAFTDVA